MAVLWLSTDDMYPKISSFRVDITNDGMKALVTLSSGDMRRALNILQVQP